MQEKSSINKLENFNDWVIAIILTIGLLIGGFLFAIEIANAEEMDFQIKSYINDLIDDCDNYDTNIQNILNTSYNYFDDYIYFEKGNYKGFLIKANGTAINVSGEMSTSNYTVQGAFHLKSSSNYNYYSIRCLDTNNYFTYDNKNIYGILIRVDAVNMHISNMILYSFNGTFTSVNSQMHNIFLNEWGLYFNGYYTNSPSITYIVGSNNLNDTNYNYYTKDEDTYCLSVYNSRYYINYNCSFRFQFPQYQQYSTNGFNVFIYNNLGIDYVRFVPNGLVTVGSHYSNNPTVSFDMVLNNNVTIPVTYDESYGYYFESIEYGKAYYEIPVIELLPSSIADFDNIYITNVVYTNEWSTVGDSGTDKFYYVDKCWLKRTYNNEEIGQVSVPYESTDTGYSQQEITDIYNMISNASTLEGTFDVEKNLSGGSSSPISFSSFQDAVVREIECYHPTGTKSSDWVSITIDNITYDSGNNMYWLEYNSNSSQSFEHRYNYNVSPYSYVRENNYAGYYDIIYFIVHEQVYDSSGTGFSTLSNTYTRYYYFISNRYYSKLMLYREMDILEYLRLGNEGQEKIYDYLFYKINNIDDNAYHFFKDKLNIDNDIVDKIREIDNSITLSTDSIMDLLNRILDALLNIDIQPLDIDLTPIITRLDSILEKQTSSNLNNDWYKNYRDWLYSETPNNVEDTPHEYFINKLNDLKSIYDIFGNWLSTSYYNDMRTVIDKYLLGVREPFTENDNMTAYYYDGATSTYYDVNTFNSFHIVENEE